jgi:hypothetical protein
MYRAYTAAIALLMTACSADRPKVIAPLNLTRRLGPDEVLAGVVHDEGALFGGVSAEGEAGDVKIYNNRVRFIIQSVRESGYYVPYGGGILDADIVRGFGQTGQDMIDEATVMVGFGRLLQAETVEIINDGTNGQAAMVRVRGIGAPLKLLSGAVENEGFPADRAVEILTEYTLEPDSQLLQIDTSIEWMDISSTVQISDIFFVAYDVAEPTMPGVNAVGDIPETYGWSGAIGQRNEVAMALMSADDDFVNDPLFELLGSIAPVFVAGGSPTTLTSGDTLSASRYFGLAPDIATLTDAWHEAQGAPVDTVNGMVSTSGYAVEGARVHVLDADHNTLTMALTQADGTWSADVPAGTETFAVATGRGPGVHYDLAPGAGWYSPYSAPPVRVGAIAALTSGAAPIVSAAGFGVSAITPGGPDTHLTLSLPGTLAVTIEDGGPAVVRVDFAEGDPEIDDTRLAHERPSGSAAWLYIKDGAGSVPIEPGDYTIVIHRGARYDPVVQSVSIVGGESTVLHADLEPITVLPNIWAADPHSHGSPSGDGALPMEGRLLTHAANGLDIHFGTDHDHIADYRLLLGPLGLDGTLASVVASEVSPVLRGHFNAYPLEEAPALPSNGAIPWWSTWREWVDTAGLFEWIRDLPSDGEVIIQSNHPVGSGGLLGNADYSIEDGTIGDADKWSPDFDAIEILNDGSQSAYTAHYLDLVNRGLTPVPVGVSDSHSHRGGVGENMTWVNIDIADMGELSPDHIREAWRQGGTVPSTGPMIEARIHGEWAPGQLIAGSTDVDIVVWAPDWMPVEYLNIIENGVVIETIPIEHTAPIRLETTVRLDPESDAAFVFEVAGDGNMAPVYPSARPWAMTAAIRLDVDGDGWTPPLPSLRL